jgi:hypothetical protein
MGGMGYFTAEYRLFIYRNIYLFYLHREPCSQTYRELYVQSSRKRYSIFIYKNTKQDTKQDIFKIFQLALPTQFVSRSMKAFVNIVSCAIFFSLQLLPYFRLKVSVFGSITRGEDVIPSQAKRSLGLFASLIIFIAYLIPLTFPDSFSLPPLRFLSKPRSTYPCIYQCS